MFDERKMPVVTLAFFYLIKKAALKRAAVIPNFL
jgi:hypothetical protein